MVITTGTPSGRLRHVCSSAGIEPGVVRRIMSHSNDVWALDDPRLGPVVLRVSWRGDVARFGREIAVAESMPASVRYPEVVGCGVVTVNDCELAYTLTRRMEGRELEQCWYRLPAPQRRAAIRQVAVMLRDLHEWHPAANLAQLVLDRPYRPCDRITGLLGADVNPLPVTRALELAEHAATVPFVDPGLAHAAADLVRELASTGAQVDDPATHGLIHGDLQLTNVWWSDPGVVTLLDLEWVRFGPPLLDMQRFCDQADADALAGSATHSAALRWLELDYPEPFQAPGAAARLRLFSLSYAIRDVIVNPPGVALEKLPADHSLHRLRRLVDGTWPAPGALPDSLAA